jgi:ATP-dependent RNA helicase DDX23/PRP28
MEARDWRIFRENQDIITKGKDIPHPIRAWKNLEQYVPEQILINIRNLGFKNPTPI